MPTTPDFAHGKDTYISVNGKDISAFCNSSEFGRKAQTHNVTMYGSPAYADGRKAGQFKGGIVDAEGKCSGVYDKTVTTGTRAVFADLVGKNVPLIRRPEGTGTGRPEESVEIVVTDYTETNPVADMVAWSCDFQCSGVVAVTTQA